MIGTYIHQRYRIDAALGQGGMAIVYRGHDMLLERDVAVKLLSLRTLGTRGRARLLEEARAAARLNHPNVVSVFDAGEFSDGEDKPVPYIVMELLSGESLRDQPPHGLEEIIPITFQVLAALEHAHKNGIIHRDLKPDNVILLENGQAKLTDFGLAASISALHPENRADGETDLIVGTVAYLSPEAILNRPVDGRADLYALGVMLYELTTGRHPFEGDDLLAVFSQHLHSEPVPPSVYQPTLPPGLEALILKLMAKEPDQRFASAAEAAQALRQVVRLSQPAAPTQPRHNLPVQLTSFIGRESELGEIDRLLSSARLVTLTGVGGTGKTRLALQAAQQHLDQFADGAWLVELANVFDPEQVTRAASQALGARPQSGETPPDTLRRFLRERQLLLILDNCEHLIEACARLAQDLLQVCPSLHILATSREALGVQGEIPFHVPSLKLPDPKKLPPADELTKYEAVQLFVERALSVSPAFALTDQNTGVVVQICFRLDGIPMAIELAAAKTRALSVDQISARLNDRFRLLTGGSRSALPRQQTLQATIDWSYSLLTETERILLRRLSVFSGGWTLASAEAVCAAPGLAEGDIFELLLHLVDKSLVVADTGETEARYHMLETIRQYARDRLIEAGEAEQLRDQHLHYFLQLAEQAAPELWSARQVAWLNRLESEVDNFRAAFEWSQSDEQATEETRAGLCLIIHLSYFLLVRGYASEGRQALMRLLSLPSAQQYPRERARALSVAGDLARLLGDREPSRKLYEESLALGQKVKEERAMAYALLGLGSHALDKRNAGQAQAYLDRTLELARRLDEKQAIILALSRLGTLANGRRDRERARAYFEENLELCRAMGHRLGEAGTLNALASMYIDLGQHEQALATLHESLGIFRAANDRTGIASSCILLGSCYLRLHNPGAARYALEEGLQIFRQYGNLQGVATLLNSLGEVMRLQGDYGAAYDLYKESLAAGQGGDPYLALMTLHNMGYVALYRGDIPEARRTFQRLIENSRANEDPRLMVFSISAMACVASADNSRPENLLAAARLFGAADALGVALYVLPDPSDQAEIDRNLNILRARTDPAAFQAAWEAGHALTLEQAADLALAS